MNEKQKNVRKNFLVNRDETGKLVVHMYDGSNQSYCVEFIAPRSKNANNRFGDIDPATKKLTNCSYGKKYTGSIKEEESVLTEENGFMDTEVIPGGSYMWSVMQKHESWKEKTGFVPNK